MKQLDFFSLLEDIEPKEEPKEYKKNNYSLVYMVTRSGGAVANLWILETDDAKKLCSDGCSSGRGRGGEWMFCWTSLEHFDNNTGAASQHKNVHGRLEPFVFMYDTGKQDKDFERLGIRKPNIEEIRETLRGMGYEITYHDKEKKKLIEEGEEIMKRLKR